MKVTNFEKKAAVFAAIAHSGQVRKYSGLPYISHPISVGKSLKKKGYPWAVICIGYLHDVLEMTKNTEADLWGEFTSEICDGVRVLTRAKNETYTQYIQRVKEDSVAKAVKIEDIKHNLSDLKPGTLRDKYELALLYLTE